MLHGNTVEEKIWNFLKEKIANDYGVAGLMGNLEAESRLNPRNLENLCERRLKDAGKLYCTDETYTAAVDCGTISREEFLHPIPNKQYGYGLAQWTSPGRKAGLYDLVKSKGVSIGDLEAQLEFLCRELSVSYKTVLNTLKSAASVLEASNIVLTKFECPEDQSKSIKEKRAGYGQKYYDKYSGKSAVQNGGNYMSVRIAHASISEKGTINGVKGDQTKKEVCIRAWYSKLWDYMAIHPDPAVREKHAKAAEAGCANDNIGYGQGDRNTLNTEAKKVGYDLSKIGVPCNTDCSEFQNVCAVASGSGATHAANGWTTSTMKAALQKLGYKIITDATYLSSGAYCVRGAIYVKAGSHTVCGLDNGSRSADTLKKAGLSTSAPAPAPAPTGSLIRKLAGAQRKDVSLAGTYHTKTSLNLRYGPDKNKYDSILIMPQGAICRCYGFYTEKNGKKWLLVEHVDKNKRLHTGFCSMEYLTK